MGGDLALAATAFAFGIGSSLLPMFLNAELYVVTLGALTDSQILLFWLVMALSVGTVLGKVWVFDIARKGVSKLNSVERKSPRNKFTALLRKFSDWMLGLLERPYIGAATVFVSSAFMVPPLAIVAIIAGFSKQPRWLFALMVFVGRTLQYLTIAFVLHGVL